MPKFVPVFIAATVIAAAPAAAQTTTPPAPQTFRLAESMQRGYQSNQKNLLAAAEKMSEADYAFKPTPEIRPFGQLVAHVALSQFGSCAVLKQETSPQKDAKEEATRSKSDLVALLKASTEYCSPVVTALTDESMTQLVPNRNNQVARGLILSSLNTHGNEMYGTMAVYLRLKGLVPPTTEAENERKKSQQ